MVTYTVNVGITSTFSGMGQSTGHFCNFEELRFEIILLEIIYFMKLIYSYNN